MNLHTITECGPGDEGVICDIINDAAMAYKGVIPADRWHEPYMPMEHLRSEIASGVRFYGHRAADRLLGVMGIQDVKDVTLIRHAYVRTDCRGRGIGGELLTYLRQLTGRPILIGTWKAAAWAVRFYQKNGFILVGGQEKDSLLRLYWTIPDRQIEESVVLAERAVEETLRIQCAGVVMPFTPAAADRRRGEARCCRQGTQPGS